MEKVNIKAGKNYRMINKETKQVHVLNAQEVANFVLRNSYDNYHIKEIRGGMIDKVPELVLYVLLFALTIASICLHIQLNY
tara:strand:- start:390 stop:632 length:243 start_codon:yes stop_codon:yes gene_type:complete